ncbi:MAG: hypothetical protein OEL55_00035 [Desulfobulbaceae bacterium]|nr:hypothetical protein [Desulfobulbaceae bacterium]
MFLSWADPAYAVQAHGGKEGLISHQLGHILFAGCMLFLLVTGSVNRWSGGGWDRFKCFIRLIIFWNILTFSGHWLRTGILDDKFVKLNGHVVGFRVESLLDVYYYCANLDHLILLPALLCLSVSLRKWVTSDGEDKL